MCGIAGAISERNIAPVLLEVLKRLEYRGYDSAGIAVVDGDNSLHRVRRMGKVAELVEACSEVDITGTIGIAHTRWATHGKPSVVNAHPHVVDEKIALVHNGVIENYSAIKEELIAEGYNFTSQTDTEVIVFLLHKYLAEEGDMLHAIQQVCIHLHGAYALAVIETSRPDTLYAVCHGCSLLIGVGVGEHFVSSDAVALSRFTNSYVIMETGYIASVSKNDIKLYNQQLQTIDYHETTFDAAVHSAEKGDYRHYMQKEIHEQAQTVTNTLQNRISKDRLIDDFISASSKEHLAQVEQVQIVACGTSMHAGLLAKLWFEQIVGVPCAVDVASEYSHKHEPRKTQLMMIALSQSGETADTIAAFKKGLDTHDCITDIAICNIASSQLARLAKITMITAAGPEIGVASTKAFSAQLVVLLVLTLIMAKYKTKSDKSHKDIIKALSTLASLVSETIDKTEAATPSLLELFAHKHSALFLGKGMLYPIALEGALKLKEVSYIHAEAYPAGELKHGPLALIDDGFPVVALIADDQLRKKMLITVEEVSSRGGHVLVVTDKKIKNRPHVTQLLLPKTHPLLTPVLLNIALQIIAYHVACARGHDVDQPRNLAKSVTVA